MDAMPVQLSDHSSAQLVAPVTTTERVHTFLAQQESIEENLAREYRQIAEIEQAIKEAHAGDFVAADEMDKLFQKLGETEQ
ncbi:ABC transporter ATP-binding protein [Dickeya ananatis]|uniref:ABC transporter ATP-binding protein n=1 Tax=Dickeya ananatis TaxID=3061286 RepID=UPI00388D1C22